VQELTDFVHPIFVGVYSVQGVYLLCSALLLSFYCGFYCYFTMSCLATEAINFYDYVMNRSYVCQCR